MSLTSEVAELLTCCQSPRGLVTVSLTMPRVHARVISSCASIN